MADIPAQPTIRRIRSLREIGIFKAYTMPSSVPDLQRYNLIYGFNGTGKTTLSRLLRSLDGSDSFEQLPPSANFEIELTDGTVVTREHHRDILNRRVLVFNTDFVSENLSWSDARAKPVFYLGSTTSRLSTLLERVERHLTIRKEHIVNAETEHRSRDRILNSFYSGHARAIAEALNLGRQYDARHLKNDYALGAYASSCPLSDFQRDSLRTLINTRHAFRELAPIVFDGDKIAQIMQRTRLICNFSLLDITIDSLIAHPTMMPWAKEGLDYHQQNRLTSCILCGNILTIDRIQELKAALGDSLSKLLSDIKAATDEFQTEDDRLRDWLYNLPSDHSISPHYVHAYRDARAKAEYIVSTLQEMIAEARRALSEKVRFLTVPRWPKDLDTDQQVEALCARSTWP